MSSSRRSLPRGRLCPSGHPWPEGLSRGRHPLPAALRQDRRPPVLRQGRHPPYLRDLRGRDRAAQFLRPGRRRHSRSEEEREIRPQARFPARDGDGLFGKRRGKKSARAILVGDLNIAPLEHDVWSHKQLLDVVSHTPVETELMGEVKAAFDWIDVTRSFVPESEKIYSWWSYRAAGLGSLRPRPPPRPCLVQPGAQGCRNETCDSARDARLEAALRSRAGGGGASTPRNAAAQAFFFIGAIMMVAVAVAITLPSSRVSVASRKLICRPRFNTLASAVCRPAPPWAR